MSRILTSCVISALVLSSMTIIGCRKETTADISKYDQIVPEEVITAKVTKVQQRQNDVVLIQLDVGEADGALVNMRFEVVRFGETLGELVITKVGKDYSLGKLIQVGRGEIVVGDDAKTRKRLRPLIQTPKDEG